MSKPVVAFVGWHNCGKTTLIRKVIQQLQAMGIKVGVIKDTHHEIKMDSTGSDSFLYQEDGVDKVALLSPDKLYLFKKNNNDEFDYLIFDMFDNVDLVIAEGFKHIAHLPKIEVARKDISDVLLKDTVENIIAMVSDFDVDFKPRFHFNQAIELADFIKQRFLTKNTKTLEVFVDKGTVKLDDEANSQLTALITDFFDRHNISLNVKSIKIKITD